MKKITVIFIIIPLVLLGCGLKSKYMNHGKKNAFSDGTDYQGMWLNGELEYIVFVPSMTTVNSQSSQWKGMTPSKKGLTYIPEGLYNRGNKVNTNDMNRVFIFNEGGTLDLVKVDKDKFKYFSYSKIQQLEESTIWPLIKEAVDSTIKKCNAMVKK